MVSAAGFKILVAYFSFRDIMVIPTFLEESEQFEDSSRRLARSGRGGTFSQLRHGASGVSSSSSPSTPSSIFLSLPLDIRQSGPKNLLICSRKADRRLLASRFR